VLLVATRLERLTAPLIVRLQVKVENTPVAVQLNVGLVLVVLVRLAGEFMVRVGGAVATVSVLVAEVAELFRSSQHVTAHVWAPSANAEVAVLL